MCFSIFFVEFYPPDNLISLVGLVRIELTEVRGIFIPVASLHLMNMGFKTVLVEGCNDGTLPDLGRRVLFLQDAVCHACLPPTDGACL